MIDDMALLKQAMEQMDAEDPDVAQAAKERAAQALGDAKLSFSKIAELIEQRRLLLRPKIVAGIKRMDQPGMLGDAAFRDTGSALRREGQSFRQIAEAIEFNTRPAPRYMDPVLEHEPPHQMAGEPPYDVASEWVEPAWMRALAFVARVIFFPLRHPVRSLALALVAVLLFYALRGAASLGQQALGDSGGIAAIRDRVDHAISSASSFVNEQILRRSKETTHPAAPAASPSPVTALTSPSPSSAVPSTGPAPGSAAPAIVSAPAATPSPAASPAPLRAIPPSPSAAPAAPPVAIPRRDTRGAPASKSATNCGSASRPCPSPEDERSRTFDDIIPERMRRRSRMGGPCIAGIGGCYWGGIRY